MQGQPVFILLGAKCYSFSCLIFNLRFDARCPIFFSKFKKCFIFLKFKTISNTYKMQKKDFIFLKFKNFLYIHKMQKKYIYVFKNL